jgi:hypothetical protein
LLCLLADPANGSDMSLRNIELQPKRQWSS